MLQTTLALIYVFASNAPYVAMAQQSVSRPGAGVSNLPLEVTHFDAPGFGELTDAVNLANGNLYVEGSSLSRNNQSDTGSFGADQWQLSSTMRLAGYSRGMATLPDRLSLVTGDGATMDFARATPDYANVPSWIKRYQTATGTTFYRSQPIPGTTYSAEWLVLVKRGADTIAHYYTRAGTRLTFFRDGEYLDYTQSQTQQFRAASAPFSSSEGDVTAAPRTEFNYTTPVGRISSIVDEYGRTTSYTWNTDGLVKITYLSDQSTPWRSTSFTYATLNLGNGSSVRNISGMTFTASETGTTTTVSRTTNFEYSVVALPNNARKILLTAVKRPTPVGQTATRYGYEVGGTRICAVEEFRDGSGATPTCAGTGTGTLRTTYTYATSSTYGGVQVTVVKTPKIGVAKTMVYNHDLTGRLRQRDEKDDNPDASTTAIRSWKYGYLRNGSLGALEEPSGKTMHYVYDDRGNLLKTKTYVAATANPQIAVLGDVRLAAPVTELIAGQTVRIGAFARSDASTQGLAWTASIGSITADGTYTAPAPLNGATSVTLTAQSKAVPSIIGQVTLPLRAITITPRVPTTALNVGETVGLSAIVDNDLATAGVNWSASTGTPVKTTNGWTYTAPSSASSVTLTATSISDPMRTATAVVTVKPVTLTLRAPAASDTTLTAGTAQKLRFAAALEGVNGSNAVTWSLTGPGTLSSDGLYTAPSAITAGTSAIVKATAVADPSKTSSATVNLFQPSFNLIFPPDNVSTSAKVQFATSLNNDPSNAGMSWSVVSGGGSITSDGFYSPPVVAANTTVVVRVTSAADTRVFADRSIVITSAPNAVNLITSIGLSSNVTTTFFTDPYVRFVYPGQKVWLSAKVIGNNYDNAYSWSVVSGGGTVSSNGVYTAPATFSAASVVLKATSIINPNRSGTITLIPKKPALIIYYPSTMSDNTSAQLTARLFPDYLGQGNASITWTKLSGSGTVTSTGLYTAAQGTQPSVKATTSTGIEATADLRNGALSFTGIHGPDYFIPGSNMPYGAYFSGFNSTPAPGVITWTTSAGTISSSGVLSVPLGQSSSITITAIKNGQVFPTLTKQINIYNPDNGGSDAIFSALISPLPIPVGTVNNLDSQDQVRLVSNFDGDEGNRGVTWTATSQAGEAIDSEGNMSVGSVTFLPLTVTFKATSITFPAATGSSSTGRAKFYSVRVSPESESIFNTANLYIPLQISPNRRFQLSLSNKDDYSNLGVKWPVLSNGSFTPNGIFNVVTFPSGQRSTQNLYGSAIRGSVVKSIGLTVTPIEVTIKTPITTIRNGDALALTVNETNNGGVSGVVWSLIGPGSVSSSGVYTAPPSVAGTADIPVTITATSVTDPLSKGLVTITLSPIKVSVTGSSTVSSGKSLALGYRVENDRAGTGVTWSTSAGTVDVNGVFTAPAVTTDTNVTVTATSKSDTTKNSSLIVAVKAPRVMLANPVPSGETLNDGSTVSIGAAVLNGSGTVTFAVNNGSVTPSGGYTLPAPLTSGTATITSSLAGGVGATTSLAYAPFAEPGEASAAAYRQQTYAYDTDHQVTAATVPATDSAGGTVAYSYTETSVKSEYVYATAVTASGQSFTYPTTVTRKTMLGTTEQFRTVDVFDTEGLVTESRRETPTASEQRKTVYTYKRTTGTRSVYRDQLEQTVETGTGGLTRTTELTMDALGRVTLQKESNVIAGVNQATGVDETQSRTTTRSYNGFDQMLSQSVGVGASQPESKQSLVYFPSGELKSSWQGTPDNLTTFAYRAINTADAGRLSTVTRGDGTSGAISKTRETTTYTYDSFGRATVTSLDGDGTGRQFDTMDRVVSVAQPDGGSLRTRYDASGAVSQLTSRDPISNTSLRVTSTNDAFGRATSVLTEDTSAGGTTSYSSTMIYDPYDRPIRMTDNRLADVGVTGDAASSYLKYDSFGRLLAQLGPQLSGNATPGYSDNRRPYMEVEYDLFGRKIKESKLLRSPSPVTPASLVMPSVSTAGVEVASSVTSYDAWNRVKQSIDAESFITNMTYDPAGNVKLKEQQVCRDPTGECIDQFKDEDGGNNQYASTKYAYDHAARVVKTTDARGNASRVRYNNLGLPSSLMDARGVTVKVMRYSKDGLLTAVFEPDTTTSTATYITSDDFIADPSGYVKTQLMKYDGTRKYPTAQCNANMNTSADLAACNTLEFDYAGRSTKTTLPIGGASIEQSYNARGQVMKLKDADNFETLYKYDAFEQMTEEKKPPRAGNQTDANAFPAGFTGLVNAYAYDKMGNLTQKTERGMITKYAYNSLGKVQAESKPKLGAISANNKLYTYRVDGAKTAETTYDYAGSLASSGFNTVDCTDTNKPNVTSGNAQCWELSKLGRASANASFSAGGRERIQRDLYNGLGLRYRRNFQGDSGIYDNFRWANVVSSGSPAHATLWRFDANGNMLKTYKRTIDASDNYAETVTNASVSVSNPLRASEIHEFQYTPTNKERAKNSLLETAVALNKGAFAGGSLTVGGSKSAPLPAGSLGLLSGTTIGSGGSTPGIGGLGGFTKRDQIEAVTATDMDITGDRVLRRTVYSYYQDGSKRDAKTYDAATDAQPLLGTVTHTYDARGRITSTADTTSGTASFGYDANGVTSENMPNVSLTYRYPTVGGLVAKTTVTTAPGYNGCSGTGVTSCSGVTNSEYTSAGELKWTRSTWNTTRSDAAGSPFLSSTNTEYTFDAHGNLTARAVDGSSEVPDGGGGKQIVNTPRTQTFTGAYQSNNALASETITGIGTGLSATYSYTLNSRGMRLSMSCGGNGCYDVNSPELYAKVPFINAAKRYDADDRAASIINTVYRNRQNAPQNVLSARWETDAMFMRYDPQGNLVLSVRASFTEYDVPENFRWLEQKSSSATFLDGQVHLMHDKFKRSGPSICNSTVFGHGWCYNNETNPAARDRDETFSLFDGALNPNPTYDVIAPFAALPVDSSATPLAAPITPLSSQVRVEPSAIQAPGNAPPSSDPSAITAPSSPVQPSTTAATQAGTGFSSGTSLTNTTNTTVSSQGVSAPTVGVQSFSVSNVTTTATSSSTTPSNAAPAKPVSSQPTQQFSSQINLEPPSSVLPPSITPLSASSIAAPSSFTPVLPASGEVSSIVAPGSSSVPVVGATPSSGTGTIVPPSSSVVPPGGSSGGIVKPGGSSSSVATVKPLGYARDSNTGQCFNYGLINYRGWTEDCTPSELGALKDKEDLENAIATGDYESAAAKFGKDSGRALAAILLLAKEVKLSGKAFDDLFDLLTDISRWDNPALRLFAFRSIGILISLSQVSPNQVAHHLQQFANPSNSNGYPQNPWDTVQALDVVVGFVSERPEFRTLVETLSTAAIVLVGDLLIGYAGKALSRFSAVQRRSASLRVSGQASATDDLLDRITNPYPQTMINPGKYDTNCVLCAKAGDDFLAIGLARPVGSAPPGGLPVMQLELEYTAKFSLPSRDLNIVVNDLMKRGAFSRSIVELTSPAAEMGHVLNAVNYNGKVVFIDFQSGLLFARVADFRAWAAKQGWSYFGFLRTN